MAIVLLLMTLLISAAASPAESSGTHTISWKEGIEGYKAPELVESKPATNAVTSHTLRIAFSYGKQDDPDVPPGSIRIEIPRYIYIDRNGKPIINFKTLMPKAPTPPNPITHTSTFHYTEEGDSIIITNALPLVAGPAGAMIVDFEYFFKPSDVKDGYTNDKINANFTIKPSPTAPTENYTSGPLKLTFNNKLNINTPGKSGQAATRRNGQKASTTRPLKLTTTNISMRCGTPISTTQAASPSPSPSA